MRARFTRGEASLTTRSSRGTVEGSFPLDLSIVTYDLPFTEESVELLVGTVCEGTGLAKREYSPGVQGNRQFDFDRSVMEAHTAFADAVVTAAYPEQAPVVAHPRLPYAVDEAIEDAIRHTAEDVSVGVEVVPDEGPAGATRIEVADTGEGIPQLELQALEDAPETQFTHGRGLGLWLIYWIVEASGGQLRFDENDPHGTILRMDLPTPDTTEL